MELLRRLKELQQHFEDISGEEFEENLIQAGYGEIEHSNQSQMKIEDPNSMCRLLLEATSYYLQRYLVLGRLIPLHRQ